MGILTGQVDLEPDVYIRIMIIDLIYHHGVVGRSRAASGRQELFPLANRNRVLLFHPNLHVNPQVVEVWREPTEQLA